MTPEMTVDAALRQSPICGWMNEDHAPVIAIRSHRPDPQESVIGLSSPVRWPVRPASCEVLFNEQFLTEQVRCDLTSFLICGAGPRRLCFARWPLAQLPSPAWARSPVGPPERRAEAGCKVAASATTPRTCGAGSFRPSSLSRRSPASAGRRRIVFVFGGAREEKEALD